MSVPPEGSGYESCKTTLQLSLAREVLEDGVSCLLLQTLIEVALPAVHSQSGCQRCVAPALHLTAGMHWNQCCCH